LIPYFWKSAFAFSWVSGSLVITTAFAFGVLVVFGAGVAAAAAAMGGLLMFVSLTGHGSRE
jgi:hypothetical protein